MKKTLTVLAACATISSMCFAADFTWVGSDDITQAEWQKKQNWKCTEDLWNGSATGPGSIGSSEYGSIQISNAKGQIDDFEGWNLDLELISTNLTVDVLKKMQTGKNGVSVNIDADSVLTINRFISWVGAGSTDRLHGNDDAGQGATFNVNGVFSLKLDWSPWPGKGTNPVFNLAESGYVYVGNYNETAGKILAMSSLTATIVDNPVAKDGVVSITETDDAILVQRILVATADTVTINPAAFSLTGDNAGDYTLATGTLSATKEDAGKYTAGMVGNDYVLTYVVAKTVPEPATATLSLLALAGLAGRRRRK